MPAEISAQLPPPTGAQIRRLEALMREQPQLAIEPLHTHGPGFYARTIRVPAGATITGKVHATEHLFILSEGTLLIVTEDGRQEVTAPFQCVARAGMKRVGHAITDVVCTNIHITTETDLAKLEADLIVPEALAAPESVDLVEAA
jgi:hypothetical protein